MTRLLPEVTPYFIERVTIMEKLRSDLFRSEASTQGPRVAVLTGMSGMGKTEIALKFAQEFEEK